MKTNLFTSLILTIVAMASPSTDETHSTKKTIPEVVLNYSLTKNGSKIHTVDLYSDMISKDRITALKAIDMLSENQAWIVLAEGLNHDTANVSDSILDALLKNKVSNRDVLKALILYLGKINTPPDLVGGENIAAHKMTKRKTIDGISRISGISPVELNIDSVESINLYIRKVEEYMINK